MIPSRRFPEGLTWQFQPSGAFQSFDSGPLQARLYIDSGHIALAGPDLDGTPAATVILFAPSAILTPQGVLSLGHVISSTALPNGLAVRQALGSGQVDAELTFPHEGVMRYEVVDWGNLTPLETALAVASDASEHFFGLGEKFDSLDQAGRRVTVLTFDDPGTKGDHSYKVAPWFVSTRGYGLHLDSSAESVFDLRAEATDRYVVAHRFSTLRFNVVYGPALTDVLMRYTGYAGRPKLPPAWTFGPWISADLWRSGGDVRYAVEQFRVRGIPASAFVFDSPWEIAYNDFQFNTTQFAQDATIDGVHYPGFVSMGELMEFLRTNGLKAICWMTPFVNVSSHDEKIAGQNLGKASTYDEGAQQGLFVRTQVNGPPLVVNWWKGQGSPIDFTNTAAKQWVADQLKDLLQQSIVTTSTGGSEPVIGGFKTDDGESGNGANTYIPPTAVYADGRTGVEMRNGYCLEYHKSIWNVLGEGGVLFARSGFTGSQAFPGCWAGDNEPNFGDNGLPSVIVAGQSAAMSGFAVWGHDIGGYQDTNFSVSPANLFMRWTQFGCFSPIMQMHRQVTMGLQYPWRFGEAALHNYQFFARLHTRLFPYIYTLAQEASTSGVPIIRPLVLLHQADPNTFDVNHTYFFGDAFLVAPMIVPNAVSREVYLPAGNWLDFWSGDLYQGGQVVIWASPDQTRMPLFVRQGAIVPMLLAEVRSLCDASYVNNAAVSTPDEGLLIQIYPGGSSHFSVYDGTEIGVQSSGTSGTVALVSATREVQLRVRSNEPIIVSRDGATLPKLATPADFAAGSPGWLFDTATGFILVQFHHNGGLTEIQY